jgi:hypothetical protein
LASPYRAVSLLVYASVILGLLFLAVLQGTPGIPSFLFPSILAGELIWIGCAFAVSRRARWAPALAAILAVVTLAVSLPQPEHYGFASSGQVVDFSIFAGGAVLQVALLISVALYFRSRRRAGGGSSV